MSEDRDLLVMSAYSMVKHIARKCVSPSDPWFADLVNDGMVLALEKALKYDPSRGAMFRSWIQYHMARMLQRKARCYRNTVTFTSTPWPEYRYDGADSAWDTGDADIDRIIHTRLYKNDKFVAPDQLEKAEKAEALRMAQARIPPKSAGLARMIFREDATLEEISFTMGYSREAARLNRNSLLKSMCRNNEKVAGNAIHRRHYSKELDKSRIREYVAHNPDRYTSDIAHALQMRMREVGWCLSDMREAGVIRSTRGKKDGRRQNRWNIV